jgi:hypothetical protein
MADTAREYLIHRFRGDAQSLRDRLDALQRGTKLPGPDAAMSRRMAEACDAVAAMIESIAPQASLEAELSALGALVPLLEQRAKANEQAPPVRAVYAGAATRIREVEAAEARARDEAGVPSDDADDGDDGDDGDDDEEVMP